MGLNHSGPLSGAALLNLAERAYAANKASMSKFAIYSFWRYEDDIVLIHSADEAKLAEYLRKVHPLGQGVHG